MPALHYLEKNPDDPDMKSVVENRIVSEEAIIEVVNAIRESGAIESAMNEAIMFIERALSALSHFPESAERRALEALAKFVVSRQI